jgi:hypothetical protein
MRQINTYAGQHFIFHLIKEDKNISITLSSDYVYPPVDKFELKELADFICNTLEINNDNKG